MTRIGEQMEMHIGNYHTMANEYSGVNKRRHKKSRGFSGAKHETLHTGSKISAKKRWDSDMSNFFEKVPKNALFWQNFGKIFTKIAKSQKIFAALPSNPR